MIASSMPSKSTSWPGLCNVMPLRVAGTDPGTSSLDLLVLEDGVVVDQVRFAPATLTADPSLPVQWLHERGPLALVAGPSGYGLPLVDAAQLTDRDLALMTLLRPDERGARGVRGFSAVVQAFRASTLPVVFLPGVVHLSTVPTQRKVNRLDLGTADKVCVAALTLAWHEVEPTLRSCCVVELGSAFTACLVLEDGQIVDGYGGTSGPCGWTSSGSWDGEVAYLLSPLTKADLFAGGVTSVADPAVGRLSYREALVKAVAGLRAVTAFDVVVLSGRLLETEPEFVAEVECDLARLVPKVTHLRSLEGAWVKHAAQGAALLADGLAGGRWADLVSRLRLREARGTVLDGLCHPRADALRSAFGLSSAGAIG
jgi:predicted butyrate kinase (DUF1464 family)